MPAINNTTNVALIIPAYKHQPSQSESVSFRNITDKLRDYPIIIIKPAGLDLEHYKRIFSGFEESEFEEKYFSGIAGYNKLLLSEEFYERFIDYNYILICQLDVLIFKDEIARWISGSYDYIGAPWLDFKLSILANILVKVSVKRATQLILSGRLKNPVGNGGLSLRKVSVFIDAARETRKLINQWNTNEDYFWSFFAKVKGKYLKTPAWKEAIGFAIERRPEKAFELLGGEYPMGVHAWDKFDRKFVQEKFSNILYGEQSLPADLNPKVSIITVNYNNSDLLKKTILNISNQNYENIEYIIIDGNSNDGSLEIIKRFDQHIDKWITEEDEGIYEAMNKGIQLATGDYIWFMNAGDLLYDNNILNEIFMNLSNADIYYGDTMIIDEKGEYVGKRRLRPPGKLTWRSFQYGQLVSHQSFIVKRELAPLFDLSYKYSADTDWQIRCLRKSNSIVNTGLFLCKFLKGGKSSRTVIPSLKERFHIMVKNYGLVKTLFNHILILFRYVYQVIRIRRF